MRAPLLPTRLFPTHLFTWTTLPPDILLAHLYLITFMTDSVQPNLGSAAGQTSNSAQRTSQRVSAQAKQQLQKQLLKTDLGTAPQGAPGSQQPQAQQGEVQFQVPKGEQEPCEGLAQQRECLVRKAKAALEEQRRRRHGGEYTSLDRWLEILDERRKERGQVTVVAEVRRRKPQESREISGEDAQVLRRRQLKFGVAADAGSQVNARQIIESRRGNLADSQAQSDREERSGKRKGIKKQQKQDLWHFEKKREGSRRR